MKVTDPAPHRRSARAMSPERLTCLLVVALCAAVLLNLAWRLASPPATQAAAGPWTITVSSNFALATSGSIAILLGLLAWYLTRQVRLRHRAERAQSRLHDANDQLQRMVMLDGLTGIANRRCFDVVLNKEVRRAIRSELPLALVLLDVDHFKSYNDHYGHPAGDDCLRVLAHAIKARLRRPGDLVARYGGEEFAVILPETDRAGADRIAEHIRVAVQDLSLPHQSGLDDRVSISVGVAVGWPRRDGETASALLDLADRALYRAKTAGRNRVCVLDALEPPRPPRIEPAAHPVNLGA